MSRLMITTVLVLLLIMTANLLGADRSSAEATRFQPGGVKQLRTSTGLATADTCVLSNVDTLYWQITNWVIGDELYKVYLDPAQGCDNPYPFTISEVHIVLIFNDTTTLVYSGDIESVDNTDPGCPMPDTMISISATYQDFVPQANAYDIWVDIDPPVAVDGPFFAGFYLGPNIYTGASPALVTDNTPTVCNSWNIWDAGIGWVDLGDNTMYNFPGRLAMYVVGTAGGSGGVQPEPELTLLSPADNSTLYGSANLWAWETSGSDIIEYVSFEYRSTGDYVEIDRDFDGASPLRDGSSAVVSGNGFSLDWDFSALVEGNYTLRATAVDTLGRSAADSVSVYLEPTPPTPTILSPDNADEFCDTLLFLMSIDDEDMSYVDVKRRNGDLGYSAGLTVVDVSSVGNYLVAPGAVALATYYWGVNGYQYLIKPGSRVLTPLEITERIAPSLNTLNDNGTYDEALFAGLPLYFQSQGNTINFDYRRNPDYFELRFWVEEQQRAVIIALSGDPGLWLAVDGFPGWTQPDGSYLLRVSNPLTGTIDEVAMRTSLGVNQVFLNGLWHDLDMMVSLQPKDFTVSRTTLGVDFSGADGWSFAWSPFNLEEDSLYFFRATGHDAAGHQDAATVLLRYVCAGFYQPGDYDGNGVADVADLVWLIDFLTAGGPPPVGGSERADANCDGYVNIADIVYYMNFAFGVADPPCH